MDLFLLLHENTSCLLFTFTIYLSLFHVINVIDQDVRIDTKLNKFIWSKGIRYLPTRVRVRISRQWNQDDTRQTMYSFVQHVPVDKFHGLQTERVDVSD